MHKALATRLPPPLELLHRPGVPRATDRPFHILYMVPQGARLMNQREEIALIRKEMTHEALVEHCVKYKVDDAMAGEFPLRVWEYHSVFPVRTKMATKDYIAKHFPELVSHDAEDSGRPRKRGKVSDHRERAMCLLMSEMDRVPSSFDQLFDAICLVQEGDVDDILRAWDREPCNEKTLVKILVAKAASQKVNSENEAL